MNPANPMARPILDGMQAPVRSLEIELQIFDARTPAEFENVFLAMGERGVAAVTVVEDPMFIAKAGMIGEIAASRRLPLVGFREIVDAGGLLAYGGALA